MSRVLVLGGASLVGSHLCDRVLEAGHEVIAVDDLSFGSWANLAHLKHEPRFVFVEHDVTSQFHATVDAVFHLALPASQRVGAVHDELRATTTCVAGTLHALETAARNGARVVLATSMGDAELAEDHGIRCAEALAVEFASSRGVDARTVRFAPAYGPRMSQDALVARLVLQALRGEPLDAGCSSDRPLRLVYAPDAAAVLLEAMTDDEADLSVDAAFVDATAGEVASVVAEVTGSFDGLVGASDDAGTGGASLREGIACTVQWFAERLASRPSAWDARAARTTTPPPLPDAVRRVG